MDVMCIDLNCIFHEYFRIQTSNRPKTLYDRHCGARKKFELKKHKLISDLLVNAENLLEVPNNNFNVTISGKKIFSRGLSSGSTTPHLVHVMLD